MDTTSVYQSQILNSTQPGMINGALANIQMKLLYIIFKEAYKKEVSATVSEIEEVAGHIACKSTKKPLGQQQGSLHPWQYRSLLQCQLFQVIPLLLVLCPVMSFLLLDLKKNKD